MRWRGHFYNNATGTLTIKNSMDRGLFLRQHANQHFHNIGLLTITNSGSFGIEGENSAVHFDNTGIVQGADDFDPKISLNGTFAPGEMGATEIGTMNFNGNQTFTGSFDMDVAGVTTHDVISTTGTATVSGVTLNLNLGSYAPASGDRIVIVSGTSLSLIHI